MNMTRLSVFNDVVLLIKFIGIVVVSFVVVPEWDTPTLAVVVIVVIVVNGMTVKYSTANYLNIYLNL